MSIMSDSENFVKSYIIVHANLGHLQKCLLNLFLPQEPDSAPESGKGITSVVKGYRKGRDNFLPLAIKSIFEEIINATWAGSFPS